MELMQDRDSATLKTESLALSSVISVFVCQFPRAVVVVAACCSLLCLLACLLVFRRFSTARAMNLGIEFACFLAVHVTNLTSMIGNQFVLVLGDP